jgi:hypothetical protein
MKADPMNAFGRVRIAQDKSRNDGSKFFGVIAGTMREILGAERSPEIDAAWRKLFGEVDQVIAQVA